MRLATSIFETIQTGNFTGDSRPYGRVTVLPYWQLNSTPNSYGNSIRGPYRYYTDGTDLEYEVPSVQNITWNRSKGQDIGTCDVTIYNAWHELNSESPELAQQLGKPGFFWPLRGKSTDSQATWNQSPGTGAYQKDGDWDAGFSWENVLVEDVIIKTYEGYGAYPLDGDGNYVSIEDNVSDGKSLLTGVWIVDSVTGGSDGMLKLSCRDIGRILLDQIIFPPLVPAGVYPLEYYTEGKSPFDSFWGPKVKTGVSPASQGEIRLREYDSSAEVLSDTTATTNYGIEKSLDGNHTSFALSNAFEDTTADGSYVWFEYTVGQNINAISFTPWAGGYECFVCVREGDAWQGSEQIISSSAITYVKKLNIPMYAPDGSEQPITVQLKDVSDQRSSAAHYTAQRVRIGFKNLYYSGIADGSGNYYRAGIRSIVAYRTGYNVSPYSTNLSDLPWTYAMDEHPTRGYWVVDDSGHVHGFGDAADYDSTAFGNVPIGSYSNNVAVGLAAHPDGKGYWVLDWRGHVWAYGSATDYGEYLYPDPYVPLNTQHKAQAIDITATHTGNGYWVAYSNGFIRGFGDAENYTTASYTQFPRTDVSHYMNIFLQNNYEVGRYRPYNLSLKTVGIASHPTKMGFWATDGSGQVRGYGWCAHYGQLNQRVYNKGMADSFRLEPLDWASAIESTTTGKGYWIVFASGHIAAFGDAVNQGPVDVYANIRGYEQNIAVDPAVFDTTIFRYLIWGLARDPDGSGFWILTAAGEVKHYNAEFWGQPGYHGSTGYRWHAGNWTGDYSEIIKELLMWAGFLYYDSGIGSGDDPSVLGGIESTGIKSDTEITGDTFDKKTVLDVIKELSEVVGYIFYIDPEGGVRVTSPNWWSAGNFDLNGSRIYVDEGTFDQADEEDEGAELFIPIVHESVDLLSYSSVLSSSDKRSELIVGTEIPDPKNPASTQYVRYIPPSARENVKPGISSMRNIVRQGIWSSQIFENQEERQLMAELIGLHAWFAQRTGSVSCVGNPCLSIDDQVRIVERNTSETYIHLINSISSTLDNDTGSYTMNLTTNWLGDADNWVITADSGHGDAYGPNPYVSISERVDSWQVTTNRGLSFGGQGSINDPFISDGEFDSLITSVVEHPRWGVHSESALDTGYGDDNDFVSFKMFGNGVDWPYYDHATPQSYEDGGSSFRDTYLTIFENGKEPILVFASVPEVFQDSGDAGPDSSDPSDYIDRLVDIITEYPISRIVVGEGAAEIGYDSSRYVDFFDLVYTAAKEVNEGIQVFGPNVELAARSAGHDASYNGVTIDSRDIDFLDDFISNAAAFDGVAISGDFSDADWEDVIDYVKASVTSEPLIVYMGTATAAPPIALNSALEDQDIALWPSGDVYEKPYGADYTSWSFSGTLQVKRLVNNVYISLDALTQNLGASATLQVYQGASLILNKTLYEYEEEVLLGNLGVNGSVTDYTFVISGVPQSVGTGQIRIKFHASGMTPDIISDQIVILEG